MLVKFENTYFMGEPKRGRPFLVPLTIYIKEVKRMNICFFIGKIISEIKFDFILNGKDISIAVFYIKLLKCIL